MNVLVLGGAGYIGSTLSRDLWRDGHNVTVFDRMLFGAESVMDLWGQDRFRLVKGDLRDEEALKAVLPGHDAVCLLAAIVGEPACNRDTDLAVETNLHGSLNALRLAKEAGVSRFLFASTCSNYGVADSEELVTEEAPLQPISTYAETKVTAEEAVLGSASAGFVPIVMRFSTAFGVSARMRFDLMVSDFSLAAVRERRVVIYGQQFWRPFVHINDISTAIRLAFDAPADVVRGRVFNVGANELNVQKEELGRMVQRRLPGVELEFVDKQVDPRSYRVEFSRVADELGFKPRWTVEEGIREVVAALEEGVWPDPSGPRYRN